MTTITIFPHLQHAPSTDGMVLYPYHGFLGATEGEADVGSITGLITDQWEVKADVTYITGAQETNIHLTPPLGSGIAALHVVGQDFVDTVVAGLEKAKIRRFF